MTAPVQTDASLNGITSNCRPTLDRRLAMIAAIIVFVIGAVIRLTADSSFKGTGYDEALYGDYILMIEKVGVADYPSICEYYLADQRKPENEAKLPPTRILYILCGWTANRLGFGADSTSKSVGDDDADRNSAIVSLRRVSLIFSILTVGVCGIAAWRMVSPGVGLGAMALVATSPLAIHMGKHALVDGFFGFWATLCLWLLWEALQRPNNVRWLIAFTAALGFMVLAKENALFVYMAMCGIVVLNRWAKFGTVTRPLILAGVLGPLFGVCVLAMFVGGVEPLVEIFKIFVTKANSLKFMITHGDGPWYRYLLELIMMEPIVTVLALTGIFTLPRRSPAFAYLLAFVLISYAIMCNLRNGMNVRFTTIWALPFATFAAAQIVYLTERLGRYAVVSAIGLIALMSGYGLRQYHVYFVDHAVYEPIPIITLRAINILKPAPTP